MTFIDHAYDLVLDDLCFVAALFVAKQLHHKPCSDSHKRIHGRTQKLQIIDRCDPQIHPPIPKMLPELLRKQNAECHDYVQGSQKDECQNDCVQKLLRQSCLSGHI